MRPLLFRDSSSRRSPLRARRRRTRIIIALTFFLGIFAGAYGVRYASYLPQLTVQDIVVDGAKHIPQGSVQAFVQEEFFEDTHAFLSRSNIFLYPRSDIKKAVVEQFPRVKDAHVSRGSLLATAVTIRLEEREAYARWCEGESCFFMDEAGFVFALADSGTPPRTPYVFRGSLPSSPVGHTYLPGSFADIRVFLEHLEKAGYTALEVSAEDTHDFSVRLARGFTVRASFGVDASALAKDLGLVLSSKALEGKEGMLEYVDLRFGNRVYYRFKGQEEQVAE